MDVNGEKVTRRIGLRKVEVLNEKSVSKDGKDEPIEPTTREKVQETLKKYNVTIENDTMHDATYLYSMAAADYIGTAFSEETAMKWIKATIDDPDAKDGHVFHAWYAKMCFNGIAIDWTEMV